MRERGVWIGMVVAAVAIIIALAIQPANGTSSQADTKPVMQRAPTGMPMGMPPMMNPMMMMGGMGPMGSALAIAGDGQIYVLQNGTLFKYSSDLKLLAHADLPAATAGAPTRPR